MEIAAARAALKDVFGYDAFRPGQEGIVRAALAGEDVFAVLPTGSGKSMCYQLPAIVDGRLTVVVSPLIALMRDQVQQLVALDVAAATLNSAESDEDQQRSLRRLTAGEVKLLFVSPERLASGGFVDRLRRADVRRLVIDEAHCVSQWGHDFRPEYRQLAGIRERLGTIQVLAFTATADAATRADIVAQLFPREPTTVVHCFDRPNLALCFEPKDRPAQRIEQFVRDRRGASGIVYSGSRQGTERIAAGLTARGQKALAYHARTRRGLEEANGQDVFLQEDGVVMVATVAFGMGINKPDLRYVVHADMPTSIESYYQEIGPGGARRAAGGYAYALRPRRHGVPEASDRRERCHARAAPGRGTPARGHAGPLRGRGLQAPVAAGLFRRDVRPMRDLRSLPVERAALGRDDRRPEGAVGRRPNRPAVRGRRMSPRSSAGRRPRRSRAIATTSSRPSGSGATGTAAPGRARSGSSSPPAPWPRRAKSMAASV